MKKLIFFFCFCILPLWAQNVSIDTFKESNPNLILNNEAKVYSGGSLVYIQGVSDKPQPKTWLDKMKVKLYGSMEIPKGPDSPFLNPTPSVTSQEAGVPVQDFFGKTKELKYISHTSDWNFIIHPLDNRTFYIQENLQFLITQDMPLTRSWPIDFEKIFITQATMDGQDIRHFFQKKSTTSSFNFPQVAKGIHKITLEYLINFSDLKTNPFVLPLISDDWPLVTDNFSGIIFVGKNKLESPQFLFGKNQIEIPQNISFETDKAGNIFFKNNYIIPALAQIHLKGQLKNLAPQEKSENYFNTLSPLLLFIISILILFIYFVLNYCEIHFSSFIKNLKRFKKKSNKSYINWFYRMGEILIGVIILLLSTFIISVLTNSKLETEYWLGLIVFSILGIIILDLFVFYPKQNEIFKLHQKNIKEKP